MLEGMTKLLSYKAEKLPNGFIIDQSNSISGSYIEEPLCTFALCPIHLAILILRNMCCIYIVFMLSKGVNYMKMPEQLWLLHTRKPARLRRALIKRGDNRVVVISVPWYLD